jgi:hypothetical protein
VAVGVLVGVEVGVGLGVNVAVGVMVEVGVGVAVANMPAMPDTPHERLAATTMLVRIIRLSVPLFFMITIPPAE